MSPSRACRFGWRLTTKARPRRPTVGAAGVSFVPYTFVIGPDRAVAWHGHPQQAELVLFIDQLLVGTYNRGVARERVRQARGVDRLEAMFRESYESQSWRSALLALDGLLKTDMPKKRLLRYKLSILLGELEDVTQARALADELMRSHAADAGFLNTLAWDVVSAPQMYRHEPEIGLRLAQAAYRASDGQDAAVADTYARALHVIGRVDLAIEVLGTRCGPGE